MYITPGLSRGVRLNHESWLNKWFNHCSLSPSNKNTAWPLGEAASSQAHACSWELSRFSVLDSYCKPRLVFCILHIFCVSIVFLISSYSDVLQFELLWKVMSYLLEFVQSSLHPSSWSCPLRAGRVLWDFISSVGITYVDVEVSASCETGLYSILWSAQCASGPHHFKPGTPHPPF